MDTYMNWIWSLCEICAAIDREDVDFVFLEFIERLVA